MVVVTSGCKMIRAAASIYGCLVQLVSKPKETSHNPLMIATRATTLWWLKQQTCFFSVVQHLNL